MISNLNILRSDVVDQQRNEMACGWQEAMSAQEHPKKLAVVAIASSALLKLLLTASGIAQCLDRAMLHNAWGPLGIVVLQINNRV